jgi:hypothetical protein
MATTPAPTPAPTPSATSAASTTFWQYLIKFIPYHLTVILVIGGVLGGIILFNHFRDVEAELKAQEAITATLQQKFQQVGPAAVSGNTQQTAPQVQQQASEVFGAALIQEMQNQDAKINSLTTLVGTTQNQVSQLQGQLTPFQSTTKSSTTGALTGYTLEENRTPPLDSVNLHYDPTQTDPGSAFRGTTWDQYQETFNASIGNWEAQKTGGFRTSVALSRTVSKPDPNNPGKMITVGTEQIPITGSNTIYTPDGLTAALPPLPQPRWTLDLGLSKGTSSGSTGYTPAATIGYRLFGRYGLFAGSANNSLIGGLSIQLGGKTQ